VSSIDTAFAFYSRHINDEEKLRLLTEHGLKIAGSVPSVIWELFGSLLTERLGAGTTGADLNGWEVKSAKEGGSFEYQYHLNTGASKLKEDCEVNHLFCTYSETYQDVIVKVMHGKDLEDRFFNAWKSAYASNYDVSVPNSQRRQRFRKSISFGYVEENGTLVMKVENGQLMYRNDSVIPQFNT